jgi:hypothetical protein
MEMTENKLKRFGAYGKVANVFFILTIVFGALLTLIGLALAIYINVEGFDLTEAINFIFENELPGSKLIMADSLEISYAVAYILVVNMAVMFATVAYVFKSVSNMFKHTVAMRTPFNQNTVRYVKNIGAVILIYVGVVFVISIISSLVSPFTGINMNIEWGLILIGLLVSAFGEMFEFGMNLQQDNESIV